jgi:hypothetical protein
MVEEFDFSKFDIDDYINEEDTQIRKVKNMLRVGGVRSALKLLWIIQNFKKYKDNGFVTQDDFRNKFGCDPSYSSQFFTSMVEVGFMNKDSKNPKIYLPTKDGNKIVLEKYMSVIIEYLNKTGHKLGIVPNDG